MFAVSCAEGVVYINVGVRSQGLGKFFLTFFHLLGSSFIAGVSFVYAHRLAFLFGIETEVFKQKHLTGFEVFGCLFSLQAVGGELNVAAEGFRHSVANLQQREFGIDFAFGFAHVRHQDKAAAVVEYLFEGGKGTADAGIVGDMAILIEGHIEIYAYYGTLAFEVKVFNVCHFYLCVF